MLRTTVAAGVIGAALSSAPVAGSGATNLLLARGRTEPVVAVDPGNPKIIVGSANTDYSAPLGDTYPTAYFASANGGRSFVSGAAPIARPYTSGADTTVAVARDGTVFYSYLGETPAYCSGGQSAIVVTHSIDHGRSYRPPRVVDVNPADDKPNMTIESIPHRSSHIFVTWTRWHDNSSDIWFARSTNGGQTFSAPVKLYSSRQNNFGSVPVLGPHSQIYVFWSRYESVPDGSPARMRIAFAASSDDGARFGGLRYATNSFRAIPSMVQPASLRVLTMPAVAITSAGMIYLAWSQMRREYSDHHVDSDILLTESNDSGGTWSAPIPVNDSPHNDRFMPAMSLLPNGWLGIAFYDRRAGGGRLDVYAAYVAPGPRLRAGNNVRVNAGTSSVWEIPYIAPGSTCFSPGRFFGDYIGTAACAAGVLCVVWADTQTRISGETDVWFARVALSGTRTTLKKIGVETTGTERHACGNRDSILPRLRVLPRGCQVGGRHSRGFRIRPDSVDASSLR